MDLALFLQILVNGVMIGGIYALIASGFTLILGVIQVFNFAQGQFYMLGAFATIAAVQHLGLPYPVAVILAVLGTGLLGALLYFGVIRWTLPSGFFNTMLVTVAFGTIVAQAAILSFGSREAVLPPVVPGTVGVGGVSVPNGKLAVIAGAVVVMVLLHFFMKTKVGISMLAAAENRDVASLQGINPERIFWTAMAVGCGLCGVAGALVAPVLAASGTMGSTIFIKALLVVLVGGTGSMAGALLAAFLVGIAESFAFQFFGHLGLLVIFVLVAILIFFRPGGLFGKPLPVPGE
ncbi:MAG: branched-chain amino acid ABC transporter permease [Thermoleophilia bacterium]|nr:branched-chain amino acid ABC transporter permease [Thermoleophilia bacterium]